MIELHGTIKNGHIELTAVQADLRQRTLANYKDGTRIVEIIKREVHAKSWEQVKMHWSLTVGTIKAAFDDRGVDTSALIPHAKLPTGTPVSRGLLQEYIYAVCPIFDDDGNRITLSKMSTVQASEFFESIRNYFASNWGIVIHDPDPNWRDKHDNGTNRKDSPEVPEPEM